MNKTPFDYAKDLIYKMATTDGHADTIDISTCKEDIPRALIAVDALIDLLANDHIVIDEDGESNICQLLMYFKRVKKEIQKL